MAKEFLSIEVPAGLSPDALEHELARRTDEFRLFLAGNLERLSMRATLGRFQVDSVTLSAAKYWMEFSYDWSAHYGCRDADHADTEADMVEFSYEGTVVTFEREKFMERTTEDEF